MTIWFPSSFLKSQHTYDGKMFCKYFNQWQLFCNFDCCIVIVWNLCRMTKKNLLYLLNWHQINFDYGQINYFSWIEKILTLGTIQVLRHHVFDFFRPTHPTLMIYSTVNHQELPFSDPTHPLLWWHNTWMANVHMINKSLSYKFHQYSILST